MEQQPGLTMNNSATSSSQPNPVSQQTQQLKKMINKNNQSTTTRRVPTPEELISHYESKGMDTKQASLKVIQDLQKALFRVVVTTNKTHPQNNNNRQQQEMMMMMKNGSSNTMALRMLDMKIDTKPGFIHMFGIGVASTAVFRGLETFVLPQLMASFGNIWNAVRSATGSDPSKSI